MIDFLKYRAVCAIATAIFLCAVVGVYIYKWQTTGQTFVYSVDFTGGVQVLFKFEKPVSANQVRDILEKKGWVGPVLREFGSNELLVRVKEFSNDSKGLSDRMVQALQEELPDNQITVLQNESVGPGIGATLRWNLFLAVLIALISLLIYIAVRTWSFAFAVGAVVALIHDPLAILGIFLLFNFEISINVIGALLAVLGYSINDTIVIFSRIRENMVKMRGSSMYDIVNVSINKTLRRTTLTSLATAITVTAMLILGGEALRDFSLALLVGIVFGTYSSIYVASPVMMLLHNEKN